MLNLKSFYYLSTITCLKARFPFLQMCWFSCSLAFIFNLSALSSSLFIITCTIIRVLYWYHFWNTRTYLGSGNIGHAASISQYQSLHFNILSSNRLFALVAQSSVMVFLFLPMVFLFTNLLHSLVVCSFFLFYLKIVCTQIRKNALNVLFSIILIFLRWLDYTNI